VGRVERSPRIVIYQANQCDPKRCTGLKLKRHGLAVVVKSPRFLPRRAIVLNPFAEIAFSPADRQRIQDFGLVALDCSWVHAQKVMSGHVRGTSRCLPILFAGNPTNYSKLTKLSTVEALAGALYIAGFKEEAKKLMSIFVWGHTFFDLNENLLESYSTAKDSGDVVRMQSMLDVDQEKRSE
jgi:pre-rRNA-processing protein TSR3